MNRILRTAAKVLGLTSVAAVLALASGVGNASALNPKQALPGATVRTLYPSINGYWAKIFASSGLRYRNARVRWYNTPKAASVQVPLQCDGDDGASDGFLVAPFRVYTAQNWDYGNSFYCPADETIYLDYAWHRFLIRADDYFVGVILAHEWGHYVQDMLNSSFDSDKQMELQADCFAGSYTRYGVYTGLVTSQDVNMGYKLLGILGIDDDGSHGTSAERQASFLNGYRRGAAKC